MQCILQDQKSISSWNELDDKPNLSQVATSGDYNDLSNTPTKLSEFENDSGFITQYTEIDPTVPDWARQENKPTYTYNEVGAAQAAAGLPTGGIAGQILEKTGEADYQIGWRQAPSNPTLFDNCYFADPINQRGQTTYTATGYTIDRWRMDVGTGAQLLVMDGYIRGVKTDSSVTIQAIDYTFDEAYSKILAGKTVTLSMLRRGTGAPYLLFYDIGKSISIAGGDNYAPSDEWIMNSLTCTLPEDLKQLRCCMYFDTNFSTTGYTDFMAAKLEFGSQQTLARQDENDKWVLNDPPPNKALELAKCQRYYIPENISFMTAKKDPGSNLALDIPGIMRIVPTPMKDTAEIFLTEDNSWRAVTIATVTKSSTQIRIYFRDPDGFTLSYGSFYLMRNCPALSADL